MFEPVYKAVTAKPASLRRLTGVALGSAQECFKVGQVVRPRVVSIDESKKRILLSLQPKKDGKELGVAASSGLRPGDLVEGEVDRLDADEQGGIAVKVITVCTLRLVL